MLRNVTHSSFLSCLLTRLLACVNIPHPLRIDHAQSPEIVTVFAIIPYDSIDCFFLHVHV